MIAVAQLLPSGAEAQDTQVLVVRARRIAAYDLATQGLVTFLDPEGSKKIQVLDMPGGGRLSDGIVERIKTLNPRVLVAIGSRAATELRQRFPERLMVFSMVLSPEEKGLVGTGLTGVRLDIPAAEQFRRFRLLLPALHRVGVIYDPKRSRVLIESAKKAAKELGLQIVAEAVGASSEVADAANRLTGKKVDALWIIPDASVVTAQTFRLLLLRSLAGKIPLLAFSAAFVRGGALAAVAPDYRAVGQATGRLVRAVLKGESPETLPVQDPPSTLIVNRRSAARLGLTIDPKLDPGLAIVE